MKLNPTVQDFLDYRSHNPCTESHHRHAIGRSSLLYTDGVKLLAEATQCYWLLDLILSHQHTLKDEEFQSWILSFDEAGKYWRATADDGNGRQLATQAISWSDFPAGLLPLKLWLSGGVLLLPEEY